MQYTQDKQELFLTFLFCAPAGALLRHSAAARGEWFFSPVSQSTGLLFLHFMMRELGEHIFSVGVMNDIPLFAAQEDFPSGGFFYVQEKGSRRSRYSGSGSKAEPDSLHLVGFFLAPAVLVPGDGAKPFQPAAFCGKGVEVASLTIHTIALIVFPPEFI